MSAAAGAFDVGRIRADFPILARQIRGKPLVYLDNAATTQKPRQVIDAISDFYQSHNANIHRSVHLLAEEAEGLVDAAREKIAKFINARKSETVIFTRNATEAINLVAYAWGRKNLKKGDGILITEIEHHSNLVPWQRLAAETGALLHFVPVDAEGGVTLEAARRAITPKTKIFAFTGMSNAFGTILPIREFIDLAHANGALALVDGAQWVPHHPIDVQSLGCDFLVFSAHKMLGPTGIGVLYGKEAILEDMDPFLSGGDMISQVWYGESTYNKLPYKFEAGTPHMAGAAAFGAAIDYLRQVGFPAIERQEAALLKRALEIVKSEEGVVSYGPSDPARRSGVVSFNVGDIHPHDIGQVFDMEGVAIRVGHHCCQPMMRKLHIGGTARASFYFYNTLEEVEAFGRVLKKAKRFFKVGEEHG